MTGATAVADPLHSVGDAAWIAPTADVVAFLSATPGECLIPSKAADEAYSVEVGRAAFKSPLLFGGVAARAGLSCNACHVDGRDNKNFFLEGLSDQPGTADVTSALFSKVREDGVFNPRPIPSLVDAASKSSFGTAKPVHSLAEFIGAAVADEFQGPAPTPAVLRGLEDYVGHLSSSACPPGAVRESPGRAIDDVRRALGAAGASLRRGDTRTADFLFLAAQHASQRLYQRYPEGSAPAERAAIEALARDLAALRAPAPGAARLKFIAKADQKARSLGRRLEAAVGRSWYDPANLRAARR